MYDLIIAGADLVDGSGRDRSKLDVAVKDGRVVSTKRRIQAPARRVVEAHGLILAPGFIDTHVHGDLLPYRTGAVRESRIRQGVTTDLSGQCGLGPAPFDGKHPDWKQCCVPVLGDAPGASWDWADFNAFLTETEKRPMLHNQAYLVSHGAVRAQVVGLTDAPIQAKQRQGLTAALGEALDAGAFGMSFGLSYLPGMYTQSEELRALAQVLADRDRLFMVHIRSHSDQMEESIGEMIEVTRATGVKMHLSHLRSYRNRQYGLTPERILALLEAAWAEGLDITYDEHPYRGGSTMLSQVLPPWVRDGGTACMCQRLRDSHCMNRLKKELSDADYGVPGWDHFSGIAGWDKILVSSLANERLSAWKNRTIADLAEDLGTTPLEAVARILLEDEGRSSMMMLEIFSDEDLADLMLPGAAMVGSDGIPTGRSHPRLYGSFPLFLQKMVRDQKILSLEEAIHRVTGLPASRLGLVKRGLIAEGYQADLVLLEEETIGVDEDYRKNISWPRGIREVFVNGASATEEQGRLIRAERPLRRGGGRSASWR